MGICSTVADIDGRRGTTVSLSVARGVQRMCCLVRCGTPWRLIPQDLPPWVVVYQQTQRWIRSSRRWCMISGKYYGGEKDEKPKPLLRSWRAAPEKQRRRAEPAAAMTARRVEKAARWASRRYVGAFTSASRHLRRGTRPCSGRHPCQTGAAGDRRQRRVGFGGSRLHRAKRRGSSQPARHSIRSRKTIDG